MATRITLSSMNNAVKLHVQQTLELRNEANNVNECFDVVDNETVYVPFAFGQTLLRTDANIRGHDISGSLCSAVNTPTASFTGTLKPEQQQLYDAGITTLNDTRSLIVASYPGFGKTILSLKIACELKLPTLIVVNKIILIEQWKEAIGKFTSVAKPVVITASNKVDVATSTFFIVNAVNIGKRPRSFWSFVRFLVVDELHQIITKVNSKNLLQLCPTYTLGLSATPYRFDEYDAAIEWYFGTMAIGKELNRKHFVYYVSTNFVPKVRYTTQGLDWNEVLNSQMMNEARNDIIVNCVAQHVDRTWLILVKRVAHAELLVDLFAKRQLKCATLLRSQLTFDKSCKILIGTTSKIGVGFDHANINALCIAADVKNYFVQFLGRCMRTDTVNPIVFDFDDDFGPLRKHFRERVDDYRKHGGVVNEYKL